MTVKRKWMLRAVSVLLAIVVGAVTYAAFNTTLLRAKWAAHQFTSARTDEERQKWAEAMTGYGDPGIRELAGCLNSDDEATRSAAIAAFQKYITDLPENDPRATVAATIILDFAPSAKPPGKRAVLQLIPTILNHTGGSLAIRCRGVAAEALAASDFDTRLAAARLAIHPELQLRSEIVPLLAAPEPQLRGAALFAVAAAEGSESIISDEELFRWLHDVDPGVRSICRDVLLARERTVNDIALGRRLTHPDPIERLKLLLDLRYDDDVPDPEPWLERLGRDEDPAVRAGAVRVAVELAGERGQKYSPWVGRVADADPHPAVRFIASYYRAQPIRERGPIIPIGGP